MSDDDATTAPISKNRNGRTAIFFRCSRKEKKGEEKYLTGR